jgi:hypothetical protein
MAVDLVLYSLRSPVDQETLLAAARAVGIEAAEWGRDGEGPAFRDVLQRATAVVWDLDDGEAGLAVLHDLRSLRPALPVLVLLRVQPGAMSLAARAGTIQNVEVRGSWHRPEDGEVLSRFLRAARNCAPVHQTLEALLEQARPPSPIAADFIRKALERRLRDLPTTVERIAIDMGLTLRRLRLRWPGPPWPPPGDMICWTTMMLFAVTGATDNRTPNVIARAFGHDEKSFGRLRRRLALPPIGIHPPEVALGIIRSAYRRRWIRRAEKVGAVS